jgi:hypothetical protein
MLGLSELAIVLCAFTLGIDVATESYYWAVLMSACIIANAYILGWFT